MAEITEDCFFFYNDEGQYLYGCSYLPKANASDVGILIVPPVGHERLRCYRECVSLARELARNGYLVLRFDYRGEGESEGKFEESDVETRLEDIASATKELRNRADVTCLYFIGFRLGGVFSLIASSRLGCNHVIFIEPIFDIKKYVQNMIRAHIITVKGYFPDIQLKSDAIIKKLQRGDTISIYGFYVSERYFQQLENIPLEAIAEKFEGHSCIIQFTKKNMESNIPPNLMKWYEKLNNVGSCDFLTVQTPFSWITKKIWLDKISGLDEIIISLIDN